MEFNNHDELVAASKNAAEKWRLVPAPQRGEVVRQFGNELRIQKADSCKGHYCRSQEKLLLRLRARCKKQSICATLPQALVDNCMVLPCQVKDQTIGFRSYGSLLVLLGALQLLTFPWQYLHGIFV